MNQNKTVRITIGPYGIPVPVQIKDETEDRYLIAFYEQASGDEILRQWYDKDKLTIHDQGEHQ